MSPQPEVDVAPEFPDHVLPPYEYRGPNEQGGPASIWGTGWAIPILAYGVESNMKWLLALLQPADPHEAHHGNHVGYACGFSGPHCWTCNEPWPCRATRALLAPASARTVAWWEQFDHAVQTVTAEAVRLWPVGDVAGLLRVVQLSKAVMAETAGMMGIPDSMLPFIPDPAQPSAEGGSSEAPR